MNNESKGNDTIFFHIEPLDKNTHSLSQKELREKLKHDTKEAVNAELLFRKNYIKAVLIHNGIDYNKVDIDQLLNGDTPEWYNSLDKNISLDISQLMGKRYKYFKLTSGMVIKLDEENMDAYRLDSESKEWVADSEIYLDYSYGNLHGEYIDFDDIYPTKNIEEINGRHL